MSRPGAGPGATVRGSSSKLPDHLVDREPARDEKAAAVLVRRRGLDPCDAEPEQSCLDSLVEVAPEPLSAMRPLHADPEPSGSRLVGARRGPGDDPAVELRDEPLDRRLRRPLSSARNDSSVASWSRSIARPRRTIPDASETTAARILACMRPQACHPHRRNAAKRHVLGPGPRAWRFGTRVWGPGPGTRPFETFGLTLQSL